MVTYTPEGGRSKLPGSRLGEKFLSFPIKTHDLIHSHFGIFNLSKTIYMTYVLHLCILLYVEENKFLHIRMPEFVVTRL